jgi:hypothetical protein
MRTQYRGASFRRAPFSMIALGYPLMATLSPHCLMKDAVRTAVGISLITGVLLGLSGNAVIAVLLLAIGVFIVVWGQAPEATEKFLGRLPQGNKILKGLGYLAPTISSPPREAPPELIELSNQSDWAVHNLLSRPLPATPADIDRLEKDFWAWDDSVSKKLENCELFTYSERSRFDSLGFIEPIEVYGNPRVDHVFAQLRMKLDRLNAAIRAAEHRWLRG